MRVVAAARRMRSAGLVRCPAILVLSLVCASPSVAAEIASAREVIEQTAAAVVAVLKQSELSTEVRRRHIEEIAYERFDFNTMSRLVLARNWKRFSEEQKATFVAEFRIYLSRSYGQRLNRYEQEDVAITGERAEARGDVTVLTKIVGGQFDGSQIDYRLRESDGEWRIIDVVIEGVSLVSNYRSQFKEVIGNKGPEGLLEQLRAKNAGPLSESDDDAKTDQD